MTALGGLIISIWLIVWSQARVSATFDLLMGIVAAVCFAIDLFDLAGRLRR